MHTRERGFILLPVVLLVALVAGLVFASQRSASALSSGTERSNLDQARAQAAAEAGLHHLRRHIDQQTCLGPYPGPTSAIQGTQVEGAGYTAWSDVTKNSPVTLTSVGKSGAAQVTLSRSNVVIGDTGVLTLPIQHSGSAETDLAFDLNLTLKGPPQPTDSSGLIVDDDTSALVHFDLSSLPAGALVTSARLQMRVLSPGQAGTLSIHRIRSAWTRQANPNTRDGQQPWASTAPDATAMAVATTTVKPGDLWAAWDVTDLAARWLSGNLPNHGIQVRAAPGMGGWSLASFNHPRISLRPWLLVSFAMPCKWSAPRTRAWLSPVADAALYQAQADANFSSATTFLIREIYPARRTVMQFDLSFIPTSANLNLSMLELVYAGQAGIPKTLDEYKIRLQRLTVSWAEAEASWNERRTGKDWGLVPTGGGQPWFNGSEASLPKDSVAGALVRIDVTNRIDNWLDGSMTNYGFLVDSRDNGSNELAFYSRRSAVLTPELFVDYQP